uniref:Uncharacterized protein n=1 Tax=Tanacetum cinerariifolium TaxID=118510 RepID=A0A6L2KL00_TANCI|nr:hypothetical protein [Tanacetum cinerariifolium]
MLHGQSPPINFTHGGIQYLSPPNPYSVPWYTQQAQNQTYRPQRALPPPSQSSPIPAFNLDDDNFEPLWASASQSSKPTKKNDKEFVEPWTIEEEIALCKALVAKSEDSVEGNGKKAAGFWREVVEHFHEEMGEDKRSYDFVNCKWKNRIRPKRKESSSEYLRMKERELELEERKRQEQRELKRLGIAQREKELDLQQKITFKYELSQNMNNLEKQLNNEILHEKGSKSALSMIKVQFDKFIHFDVLKPFDPYSSSASYDQKVKENFKDYTQMEAQSFKDLIIQHMESIKKCIVERARHEQEIQNRLKRIVSDKGNDQVEKVDSNVIPDSPDMCDNEIQTDHNAVECDDERVALANLITNLNHDVDENKKIQKKFKKANTSLTQELKEFKSTLAETSRILG